MKARTARLWIVAALLWTAAAQPLHAVSRHKKLPVPAAADQAASMKLVKDIYGDEYKRADTLPAKQALAKKLLDSGKKTQDDPPGRFVLLKLSRDIATQALDGLTAFQAVDAMSEMFEIDPIVMKAAVMEQGAAHAKTIEQHKRLMEVALTLVDAAIAEDNYAVAKELCDFASSQAAAANETKVIASAMTRGKEVEEVLAVLYDKAQNATAMLHENPVSPGANTAHGKYLCFVKGDWDNGILMLALGDDPKLKALANNELVELSSRRPEQLGDDWWDQSENEAGAIKSKTQERATYWYREALPKLSGLAKARVEKRLATLAPQQPSPVIAGKSTPKESALPEHDSWTVPYTWTTQVQKVQPVTEFNPQTHQMMHYDRPYTATEHHHATKTVKAKLIKYDFKAGNVVLNIRDEEKKKDLVRSFKYAALGSDDKKYLDSVKKLQTGQ